MEEAAELGLSVTASTSPSRCHWQSHWRCALDECRGPGGDNDQRTPAQASASSYGERCITGAGWSLHL